MVYKLTVIVDHYVTINSYNTNMSAFYTDCYKILKKDDFAA